MLPGKHPNGRCYTIAEQKCQTCERKCHLTNTHRQFQHVIGGLQFTEMYSMFSASNSGFGNGGDVCEVEGWNYSAVTF